MKRLHIAQGFSLPEEAVCQTFGILAIRGAGKSNAAVVMAEEMYAAGLPFVAIDPKGDWPGLRQAGDGGPGLPIPVFGGDHADVPLDRAGGSFLADLIVDQRLSCVVDVSEFSEADKIRFLIDFTERLYRRNKEPLHLFLEEADDYCPQKPFREQARLVGAFQRIVKRGRFRGLGCTLITQRSAALNKDVLYMAETLFLMRTLGPRDKKAAEGWIEHQGQSDFVLAELPSMKAGEAFVYSPGWLNLKEPLRIQFRRRNTFDSGATPTGKKARRPATRTDVDLDAIRTPMAATIEKAKAEDPRELKAEIQRLRKALEAKEVPAPRVEEVQVLDPKQLEQWRINGVACHERAKDFREAVDKLDALGRDIITTMEAVRGRSKDKLRPAVAQTGPRDPKRTTVPPRRPPPTFLASDLSGPEQRILDAVAWLNGIGVPEPEAVAFVAGYKPGGGAFGNPKGRLRARGLIDYRGGGIVLTEEGSALAYHPDKSMTNEQLHDRVLARLSGPEERILKPLLASYPEGHPNEELAELAGYKAGGGAYGNPRGRLRTLGLIEYRNGCIYARDILFPK